MAGTHFQPLYLKELLGLGLTSADEVLVLTFIVDKISYRVSARQPNANETDLSTAYIHQELPVIGLRTIERALSKFGKMELLAYSTKKNDYGKVVRFISIISPTLQTLVGLNTSQVSSTKQKLLQVRESRTASRELWKAINSATSFQEFELACDNIPYPIMEFLFAWKYGHQKCLGTPFKFTGRDYGLISNLFKAAYNPSLRLFNYVLVESYLKADHTEYEATISNFLKWERKVSSKYENDPKTMKELLRTETSIYFGATKEKLLIE